MHSLCSHSSRAAHRRLGSSRQHRSTKSSISAPSRDPPYCNPESEGSSLFPEEWKKAAELGSLPKALNRSSVVIPLASSSKRRAKEKTSAGGPYRSARTTSATLRSVCGMVCIDEGEIDRERKIDRHGLQSDSILTSHEGWRAPYGDESPSFHRAFGLRTLAKVCNLSRKRGHKHYVAKSKHCFCVSVS